MCRLCVTSARSRNGVRLTLEELGPQGSNILRLQQRFDVEIPVPLPSLADLVGRCVGARLHESRVRLLRQFSARRGSQVAVKAERVREWGDDHGSIQPAGFGVEVVKSKES